MTAVVRVGVIDHGSGNLHSACRALSRVGAEVVLSSDVDELERTDALVLPGVGALASCMAGLRAMGGDELAAGWVDAGRHLLGICVGHQMLFEDGEERGQPVGCLGLLPGSVSMLPAERLPHMGWNTVTPCPGSRLFAGIEDQRFYFVHSYGVLVDSPHTGITTCRHQDAEFVAATELGPICSTQFHPEKSGAAGARLLRNWLDLLDED
ncbi:imidazole glycerol phosphate synthase subunit HisH [Acidipropionibacterium jensenii]|uniref:imidazole glycerol phosphate synthase subunit HisH n=1 Tax=Acidipropionibacterium jensenii TaxID=1749 RepID=UPI000BC2D3BF|nr:imidazole glycerol phosphate synthase subunit HisH [Acidipropionibacterium jensenii]AZZ42091.1 imidazole glycerol phosphate synthase subunit HisH [Acidipropionibacterium jensenii]